MFERTVTTKKHGPWKITLNYPINRRLKNNSSPIQTPNNPSFWITITNDMVVARYGPKEMDGVTTSKYKANHPVLEIGQEKTLTVHGVTICTVRREK